MGACWSCRFTTIGQSLVKFKLRTSSHNTKLFRKTKEIGDKQKLQDDIDKLVRWSEKWQMLFNVGKCKCQCWKM